MLSISVPNSSDVSIWDYSLQKMSVILEYYFGNKQLFIENAIVPLSWEKQFIIKCIKQEIFLHIFDVWKTPLNVASDVSVYTTKE